MTIAQNMQWEEDYEYVEGAAVTVEYQDDGELLTFTDGSTLLFAEGQFFL